MTRSPRKNVPDVGIELGAACMPSELASDQATAPDVNSGRSRTKEKVGMSHIHLKKMYFVHSFFFRVCSPFQNIANVIMLV